MAGASRSCLRLRDHDEADGEANDGVQGDDQDGDLLLVERRDPERRERGQYRRDYDPDRSGLGGETLGGKARLSSSPCG